MMNFFNSLYMKELSVGHWWRTDPEWSGCGRISNFGDGARRGRRRFEVRSGFPFGEKEN